MEALQYDQPHRRNGSAAHILSLVLGRTRTPSTKPFLNLPSGPVYSDLSRSALHRKCKDPFLPDDIHPFENKACDDYASYRDKRSRQLIGLWNREEKKAYVKTADDSTRYSKEGQRKIKREIKCRLGNYPTQGGVLITLTYLGTDTTKEGVTGTSRPGAWWGIGYASRYLMDGVNKWRTRNGYKKVWYYIRVMEDQKGRGYPAPHIWFPGLQFLAPIDVLKGLWPYGDVDVKRIDGIAPATYICKYITKMEGKDFMLAMMKGFGTRFFSTSRSFKYRPKEKFDSGRWVFAFSNPTLKDGCQRLLEQGYSVADPHLILGRGG